MQTRGHLGLDANAALRSSPDADRPFAIEVANRSICLGQRKATNVAPAAAAAAAYVAPGHIYYSNSRLNVVKQFPSLSRVYNATQNLESHPWSAAGTSTDPTRAVVVGAHSNRTTVRIYPPIIIQRHE